MNFQKLFTGLLLVACFVLSIMYTKVSAEYEIYKKFKGEISVETANNFPPLQVIK